MFTGNSPLDALDKQQSALLAALITKRIENITAPLDRVSGKENTTRASELLQRVYEADLMAEWLTDWDKTAALPVLRTLWKRHTSSGMARLLTIAPKSEVVPTLQAFPPTCILRRVKAGDTTSLEDYAVWLKAQRDNKNWQESGIFEPLWRYPAQTMALADDIFNDKTSAWNPLIDPRRAGQLNAFVAGPLLAIPAYRAQVARQLKNWAKCGTIEIMANDKTLMRTPLEKIEDNFSRDAATPPLGFKGDFRVCDFYAWQLSQIDGAPRCEFYWPFAKRDRAVDEVSEWLQAYGTRLRPRRRSYSFRALARRNRFSAFKKHRHARRCEKSQRHFFVAGSGQNAPCCHETCQLTPSGKTLRFGFGKPKKSPLAPSGDDIMASWPRTRFVAFQPAKLN